MELKIKFPMGGLEDPEFEIIHDCEHESSIVEQACKHAHSFSQVKHTTWDKQVYYTHKWIVPRVAATSNEGGHNGTGICIDCILEGIAHVRKS